MLVGDIFLVRQFQNRNENRQTCRICVASVGRYLIITKRNNIPKTGISKRWYLLPLRSELRIYWRLTCLGVCGKLSGRDDDDTKGPLMDSLLQPRPYMATQKLKRRKMAERSDRRASRERERDSSLWPFGCAWMPSNVSCFMHSSPSISHVHAHEHNAKYSMFASLDAASQTPQSNASSASSFCNESILVCIMFDGVWWWASIAVVGACKMNEPLKCRLPTAECIEINFKHSQLAT